MENEIIQIDIEKSTKQKVDEIFRKLGMTTQMAIKIFLNKVVISDGMPFNVRIDDPSNDKKGFERIDRSDGDRGGDRGGFRGGFRSGGDRGGDRGGFRSGGDRGGDRSGFSGGDRGGDRGGFRGGDRDKSSGFRRDRNPERNSFGDHKRSFDKKDSFKNKSENKEEFNLRGNLLDDDRRMARKSFSRSSSDSQPRIERKKISFNKNETHSTN